MVNWFTTLWLVGLSQHGVPQILIHCNVAYVDSFLCLQLLCENNKNRHATQWGVGGTVGAYLETYKHSLLLRSNKAVTITSRRAVSTQCIELRCLSYTGVNDGLVRLMAILRRRLSSSRDVIDLGDCPPVLSPPPKVTRIARVPECGWWTSIYYGIKRRLWTVELELNHK